VNGEGPAANRGFDAKANFMVEAMGCFNGIWDWLEARPFN
jgi:hypothetical protein